MIVAAKPVISVALVLFLVVEISSSEPADGLNTTITTLTTPTLTNVTSTVASAVPVTVSNVTTAAIVNVTTAIPVVSSTPSVAMIMEGNSSPPKKSELRKDSSEPKKKVEPEKQHEEKSDQIGTIPVKEITIKPSVVKPRKGVEDLKIGPNELCANVSADQMEKCQLGLTAETKSTSSTTEDPPTVSPHSKPNPKPNVTLDAPDQQTPAKREDYIIPVVGIIFVIPLIVILGALVYKKGVDLWERRHYRPMDFLIDGIYNNQWKSQY